MSRPLILSGSENVLEVSVILYSSVVVVSLAKCFNSRVYLFGLDYRLQLKLVLIPQTSMCDFTFHVTIPSLPPFILIVPGPDDPSHTLFYYDIAIIILYALYSRRTYMLTLKFLFHFCTFLEFSRLWCINPRWPLYTFKMHCLLFEATESFLGGGLSWAACWVFSSLKAYPIVLASSDCFGLIVLYPVFNSTELNVVVVLFCTFFCVLCWRTFTKYIILAGNVYLMSTRLSNVEAKYYCSFQHCVISFRRMHGLMTKYVTQPSCRSAYFHSPVPNWS